MSAFAALDRIAQVTTEKVMADPFQFTPMMLDPADKNGPFIADTGRSVATIMAIFVTKIAKPLHTRDWDPKADRRPGVSAPKLEIEIDTGRVGITVKNGDLLAILDRVTLQPTGQSWRVTSTDVNDMSRTIATVNQIS